MTRYFILEENDPFAESVNNHMMWYLPTRVVWANVMKLATYQCVRDSKGGVFSGDEFWRLAGDLTWNESRVNQARRVDVARLAVPS